MYSGIIRPMFTWSGKTLGNVLIGDLIARGGMAEVYNGEHVKLNRKVAIKIMRDHVEEDPDSRTRFDREARVVAGLNHPNIIQIFDYDLVDGRPCIIMELVSGTALSNYMKALQKREEKLSHTTIVRLLSTIASAIDYAHERNIVHRDIKPANILLRSNSGDIDLDAPLPDDVEPVLTDFGLVRLLDSSTQTSTGTVSGTPSYMSPEQARGDKVDRKTDIYSLGVVLYEMLAGAVPFDAESSFGVLMKHLNEPPPPIRGISADMQAVINRSLAKDPAQRYESATELVHEFNAVLNGQKVSTKTSKVSEQANTLNLPQPPPSAMRTPLFVGGTLILAALVVLGVWLFRQPAMIVQPELPPDRQVGRIIHQDYNNILDKAVITINGLLPPQPGTHYEVWYLSQGGESHLNAGTVAFDGQTGQLNFIHAEEVNLLEAFDQVNITVEPNTDPNPDEPSDEIAASSVFPPFAFVHIRHLLVSFENAPDKTALVQGVWAAADEVNFSMEGLRESFDADDEEGLRLSNEEIINILSGNGNADLYKDWNGDGEISDPIGGYGLLPNPQEQGYLPQTRDHARFAAEAPDATSIILQSSDHLIVCINNMNGWSQRMLELALQLQDMPFGPDMEPVIAEMDILAERILSGDDRNENGRIEPIPGEGGADTAYDIAYFMADMQIFPGPNRLPPPAQRPSP